MALFDTSSHLDFSCREMRQNFICYNRLFINGLWLNPVFCTDATQRPYSCQTLFGNVRVLAYPRALRRSPPCCQKVYPP